MLTHYREDCKIREDRFISLACRITGISLACKAIDGFLSAGSLLTQSILGSGQQPNPLPRRYRYENISHRYNNSRFTRLRKELFRSNRTPIFANSSTPISTIYSLTFINSIVFSALAYDALVIGNNVSEMNALLYNPGDENAGLCDTIREGFQEWNQIVKIKDEELVTGTPYSLRGTLLAAACYRAICGKIEY